MSDRDITYQNSFEYETTIENKKIDTKPQQCTKTETEGLHQTSFEAQKISLSEHSSDSSTLSSTSACADRTWAHVLRHELDFHGIILIGTLHALTLWGFYRAIVYGHVSNATPIFIYVLGILSAIGTLAGAHRYFSHRAFAAHWLLRLFLLCCQTISGQRSLIRWAREHRTHHRYEGTNGDCANINRGFFFAHIGWLLVKPHPECEKRMAECNVDDLWRDPMIRFQFRYYTPLMLLGNVLLPTVLPHWWFGESLLDSFLLAFAMRYVYTLHIAFCGNSVLHSFGTKSYDSRSSATNCTWVIWATLGGGYHSFHHAFPYDYVANEYEPSSMFNLNTCLINLWVKMGLAYDLKRATPKTIARWKRKYGDRADETTGKIVHRPAWLDYTLGILVSASPLWIILLARMIFIATRNYLRI